MGTLKYISLSICFLLLNCKRIEYTKQDNSFYAIYFKNWNSTACPKKIIFERYLINTNFNSLIDRNSDFEIKGCDEAAVKFNQRIVTPNVSYKGRINCDIKLIIDDSLEYKITEISNKIDTLFSGGRPGDFIIMNNIKTLVINGHKVDNTKAPLNIAIPTEIGKIIKK